MTARFALLPVALLAAAGVQPVPGEAVVGTFAFHRPQKMEIDVLSGNRLALKPAFDGACSGDAAIGELWMSFVPADKPIAVRDGAFSATVTGSHQGVGGDNSRTAYFTWKVSGRFTAKDAATVTLSGSAVVRRGGKVVARCTMARPVTGKLTHPSGK